MLQADSFKYNYLHTTSLLEKRPKWVEDVTHTKWATFSHT